MSTTTQIRRRRPPHPAVLALASSGSSVVALAQALGVRKSAAGYYLSGRRGLPDRFPAVLTDLVGEEAAAEITALIPTRSAS
jgi:predicted transcriptional regulator